MDPGADDRGAAREPMAEPAALPWGMDKADVQKSSLTELTDEKLARFVIGQQKKTKFEKEREEREIKKRKADEEAAAMYAKFVASFEDEDDTMGKAFVRGGSGSGSEDAIYRLQSSGSKKKGSDMDRLMQEMKHKESESFLQPPMKKKRREMDLLVEEIKSREPTLPTVDEIGPVKGSFDHGDPNTTNLHVGNLALTVTEETLERVFGKFGRIFSVKVMWPRSEEERSRGRMSGFVSFYERRAADDARVHLNDSELDGQRIVVGWGKAVKIEATPSPSPLATALSGPIGAAMGQLKIEVLIPKEEKQRKLIDHLASYVAKDGEAFEATVRSREAGNPQYAFLAEVNSQAAVYYRWRVFAFAMGDSATKWREAPFQMTVGGPVWVPPSVPVASPRGDHRRDQRSSRDRRTHSRSRSRHRGRSPRRGRSRTPSRSRSRGSSRGHGRRRSRSGSRDRRRRSRSVSRSRSSSSDRSSYDRRRRASRSRSRARGSERRPEGDGYSSRRDSRDHHTRSRSTSRSPYTRRDDPVLKKDESLLTGQQLARARDLERGREPNRLPRDEHDRFTDLLDNLTLERESIKQAMGCALDNSESAVELVHMLRKRFHRDDVSAVQLVGYLYVASDLLHNSSAAVKNASLFRTTFQECLPEILDCLRRVHRGLQGRMSANAMRDKVLGVLTAWGSWSLFPPHYLVGLNATFMRKVEEDVYIAEHQHEFQAERLEGTVEEERLRKACAQAGILSSGSVQEMLARLQWLKEFTAPATAVKKPVVVPVITKPVKELRHDEGAAEPIAEEAVRDTVEGDLRLESDASVVVKPSSGEQEPREDGDDDLDGEPLDGEPFDGDDLDGEPLDEPEPEADEDLDGEPLDEEDVDGEPLDEDEDLDGEPM